MTHHFNISPGADGAVVIEDAATEPATQVGMWHPTHDHRALTDMVKHAAEARARLKQGGDQELRIKYHISPDTPRNIQIGLSEDCP